MELSDLFVIYLHEMHVIDPVWLVIGGMSMLVHVTPLNGDIGSPWKRLKLPSTLKDLLDAEFISEAKYTYWIFNIILVKKTSVK